MLLFPTLLFFLIGSSDQVRTTDDLQAMLMYAAGLHHYNLKDYDKSIRCYTLAIEQAPDCAEFYYRRGLALCGSNKAKEAITDLDLALRLEPNHIPALIARARLLQRTGNTDKAFNDIDAAISAGPNNSDAYNARAEMFEMRGHIHRAIQDYSISISLNPNFFLTWLSRGICWASLGNSDRALVDYDEAIRLSPTCFLSYYNRGCLWLAKKELDKALIDFNQSIRLNNRDPDAFFNRGVIMRMRGEWKLSLEDFTTAIELDSAYTFAYISRAWILAACPNALYRDGKSALKDAIVACNLTLWNNLFVLDVLAGCYAENGDFFKAVELEKIIIASAERLRVDPAALAMFRHNLKEFEQKRPIRFKVEFPKQAPETVPKADTTPRGRR